MLYILDTDHISLLQRGNQLIRQQLLAIPMHNRATTIISQTEQFLGWWSEISRSRQELEVVRKFQYFQESIAFFHTVSVLPYDVAAATKFRELRDNKIRIGTQDLRIASIALSRNATVVTRNLRDFQKVPDLVVEDWSQ